MISHWKQPNSKFDVKCAGLPGVLRLDVITAKIESANGHGRDAQSSRDFLAMQFKAAYVKKFGRPIRQYIGYERLIFVPVEDAAQEQRPCCGNERCTQCDVGHHERCRDGCQIGR